MCGICNICCLIRLLTQVRMRLGDLQTHHSVSPVHYFQATEDLFSLLYKVVTMKRFWLNQREYLNILEVSQKQFYEMSLQLHKNVGDI